MQSVRLNEHFFAELPEPLHILDAEGRILFWNHGAEVLYGFQRAEAIGCLADELLQISNPADRQPSPYQGDCESANRWVCEVEGVTKSGKLLRIQRRINRVNFDNAHEGMVVFDAEFDQRSRQQQAGRRRQRLESLGSLASGIAHDLNNLLTPILMSCKMLQRDNPNVDRNALLETISSGATRGAELIAQLLTFARGGEGTHDLINLKSFMPEIVAILQRAIPESVEVSLEFADDLPEVLGDETELSQVVVNLAINARDAMPEGGILSIRAIPKLLNVETSYSATTLAPGKYVAIEVSDTGTGIADEIRDRIFDPFFSTKQRGQGTGLGLSTTIGIVKSHRGAIGIETAPDQGTTVTVMLPTESNHDLHE